MLYGSGSIGGVYRMVTNKPDLAQTTGRIALAGSLTQGGQGNKSVDGMINLPLVTDRIGLRLVGYFDGNGGYIDDIRLNERNINASHVYGGRGMLRWDVSDRWTFDLASTIQYIDQDDSQYFTAEAGAFKRDNYVSQPYSERVIINTGTISGDLDWANLISSTSVIDRDISAQYDATLGVPQFVPLSGIASPFRSNRDIEMISHESRLTSEGGGPFRWLLGAFFLRTRETYDSALTVPGAGAVFAGRGFPSDIVHQEHRKEGVTELAFFGNLEWFLSDAFSVDVGARVFRNSFNVTSTTSGVSIGGQAVAQGRRAQTDAVPKIVFSYRAADDLLIYLRAEEGYRTGGVNIDTPIVGVPAEADEPTSEVSVFKDDKLWNMEMGIKSKWLQGRLTLNAAAFYVNWKNIQTDQLLPTGLTYVTNAGNGRNLGGEIEVTAKPWPNLEIMANLLVNSPHLTTINSALGAAPGDELPGVSDLDAGAAVTYTFRVIDAFDGRIAFTYNYIGKSRLFFDESNTAIMGGYQLGNLVMAMTRGGLEFGISARNLWNSRGNSFAFGNPFSLPVQHQVTPVQPRTIGVFANYQF
jgi:outer membrane receptor protein involved in Fe transport